MQEHVERPPVRVPEHVQTRLGGDDGLLGARVARNLVMLTGGRAAAAVLQFTAFALLAAHLGPEPVGVYTFALAAVALFRLFPTFGFEQIVPRDVAQRPELEASLVPNVVYVRLVLAAVGYGLLALTLVAIGYEPDQRDAALLAGLALVLVAGETLRASLATRLRLGRAATADVVEGAVLVVGTAWLVAADSGLTPFLVLWVAAKAANVLLVVVATSRLVRLRWRPDPSSWQPALRAAAPIAAAAVVIALYYRLDVVVLARIAPDADVGQYGLALKFLDAAVLLTAVLMSALQPLLARSVVEDERVLQHRYATSVHLTAVVSTLILVAGTMTAWRVVPAVPGFEAYDGAGVALALLAPAAAFILVATVVQGTLLAGRLERAVLRISLVGLATNVVLIAALIPPYSYYGAALATSVTELVLIGLSLRAVRALGVRWPLERLPRLALGAVLVAAVFAAGYALDPFLQLALGTLAFCGIVVALGIVGRAELAEVVRRTA